MSPTSEDRLMACLDDIRAGRRALQDCLVQEPDLQADLLALSPLVELAREYSATTPLDDAARLRLRQELRAAMSSNGHHASESQHIIRQLGRKSWLPAIFAWPLDRLSALGQLAGAHGAWLPALTAGVSAAVAGGAVVYAAQTAGPESALYPVRQAVQVVSETLAPATSPTATPTATSMPNPTATFGVQPGSRPAEVAQKASESRERQRDPGLDREIGASAASKPTGVSDRAIGASLAPKADVRRSAQPSPSSQSDGGRGLGSSPNASASASASSSGDGGRNSPSPSPSASSSSRDGGPPSPSPSSSTRSSSSPSASSSSGSSGGSDGGSSGGSDGGH